MHWQEEKAHEIDKRLIGMKTETVTNVFYKLEDEIWDFENFLQMEEGM